MQNLCKYAIKKGIEIYSNGRAKRQAQIEKERVALYELNENLNFITNAQINRGIITLYLIHALEERGEIINFHTFDLSFEYDFAYFHKETINIEINLKNPGDLFLDIEKCYFPIRSKEFLRRIMFRVQESIPVKYIDWQNGYGKLADEEQIRSFYNLKPTDIVISNPTEMGIKGNNLYEDTLNVINKIKMNDEFNTEKIKKLIHK